MWRVKSYSFSGMDLDSPGRLLSCHDLQRPTSMQLLSDTPMLSSSRQVHAWLANKHKYQDIWYCALMRLLRKGLSPSRQAPVMSRSPKADRSCNYYQTPRCSQAQDKFTLGSRISANMGRFKKIMSHIKDAHCSVRSFRLPFFTHQFAPLCKISNSVVYYISSRMD